MDKRTNIPVIGGSAIAAGIVSEIVVGALTGITSIRRFFIRAILIVAVIVAAVSFTMGVVVRDYQKGSTAPGARAPAAMDQPPENRQVRPSQKDRPPDDELLRLIQREPL